MKSESDNFFSILSTISDDGTKIGVCVRESNISFGGAIRKRYQCNQCEKEFNKQGLLKKHIKSEHGPRKSEVGEVWEYGEKGGMS